MTTDREQLLVDRFERCPASAKAIVNQGEVAFKEGELYNDRRLGPAYTALTNLKIGARRF